LTLTATSRCANPFATFRTHVRYANTSRACLRWKERDLIMRNAWVERVRLPFVIVAAVMLLLVSARHADAQNATIRGRVADESGAAMPGVAVTITSPALLVPQSATTDG